MILQNDAFPQGEFQPEGGPQVPPVDLSGTTIQPPFWVPRPAIDMLWSPATIRNAILLQPTAEPVPFNPTLPFTYDETPPWRPVAEMMNVPTALLPSINPFSFEPRWPFIYDETPPWSPATETLNVPTSLLPIVANPFSFEPRWPFTYDETLPWQRLPAPSYAITLTTTQIKFFGQPGQAPTKRWSSYLYDETPPWQSAAEMLNVPTSLLPAATSIPTAPFYAPDPYEFPVWRPTIENLNSPTWTLPTGAPFSFEPRWPFTYDETPPWQRLPAPSYSIVLTTTQVKFFGQPGQAPPFRWNATYDDSSLWTWPPHGQNRALISSLAPVPFQHPLPTFYLETPHWQGSPSRSYSVTLTTTQGKFFGQPGQVPTKLWSSYLYDETPTWLPLPENMGVPTSYLPVATTTIPLAPFYYPTPGAEDAWQRLPAPSYSIALTTTQVKIYGQPGQSPPRNWLSFYSYDETPPWRPTIENLNSPTWTLPATAPFSFEPRWPYTYDETPPWRPTPENLNVPSLLFPVTAPFSFEPRWPFTYDETPPWQRLPAPSYSIILTTTQAKFFGQPGQTPPFRPNFTYDDAAPYTWGSTARNRNVLLPTIPPLVHPLPTFYLETPHWQGTPLSSRAINVTASQAKFFGQPGQAPPRKFWADLYWNDDPKPPYTWGSVASRSIFLTTTQSSFYGQPGQVPPFRPNFTFDDSSLWTWQAPPVSVALIIVRPPPPISGIVSANVTVTAWGSKSTVLAHYSVSWVR